MTEHNDNGPGPDFVQVGQIDPSKIVPEAFDDWLQQPVVEVPLAFLPEGQREPVKKLLKITYEAGFGVGAMTVMGEINRISKMKSAEQKNNGAGVIFAGPPRSGIA